MAVLTISEQTADGDGRHAHIVLRLTNLARFLCNRFACYIHTGHRLLMHRCIVVENFFVLNLTFGFSKTVRLVISAKLSYIVVIGLFPYFKKTNTSCIHCSVQMLPSSVACFNETIFLKSCSKINECSHADF